MRPYRITATVSASNAEARRGGRLIVMRRHKAARLRRAAPCSFLAAMAAVERMAGTRRILLLNGKPYTVERIYPSTERRAKSVVLLRRYSYPEVAPLPILHALQLGMIVKAVPNPGSINSQTFICLRLTIDHLAAYAKACRRSQEGTW